MSRRALRRSQLVAFDNAAAGHDGVLSDASGELIVKPCKLSEIEFYRSLEQHPEIKPFVPTFFGELSINQAAQLPQDDSLRASGTIILPGDISTSEIDPDKTTTLPVVEHDWAPSHGGKIKTDSAVVLEDLTSGFAKPNILDVKLGARLWADDAPKAKRERLEQAAADTTSKSLGFRIAGMRTYKGAQARDVDDPMASEYHIYDKHYGRGFTAENVIQGLRDFFVLKPDAKVPYAIRQIIRGFITDLQVMSDAISQLESRMYSASLLFVYEGDRDKLKAAIEKEFEILDGFKNQQADEAPADATTAPPILIVSGVEAERETTIEFDGEGEEPSLPAVQTVKLIDFAHAQWTPGQGSDDNLLDGIRNVIKLLCSLITPHE